MRESIKADPTITGAKGITRATAPKVSTGTTSGAAKNYKLGIGEQAQINQADNTLQNNRALRSYQENAAAMQLQQNLAKIDRSSLDAYKGIANNYAARGMQRSGGYIKADDQAYTDTQEAKTSQVQNVQDLINTNKITDTGEQQSRNNTIQQLLAQILGNDAANKLKQIGGN
jgi:hypothetical protein